MKDYGFKQKFLLTVDEFKELTSVGDTRARQIISQDDFPKVKNGRNTLIISSKVDEWLMDHMGEDLSEL